MAKMVDPTPSDPTVAIRQAEADVDHSQAVILRFEKALGTLREFYKVNHFGQRAKTIMRQSPRVNEDAA